MIFDCFTFFNELDLLELRMTILDSIVDRFVICEAPFTFRGAKKPLILAEHLDRFARFRDRITLLTLPGSPNEDAWQNEWSQRDYLINGVMSGAADDIVLLGDCDEIPDPQNLRAQTPGAGEIVGYVQRMSVGYLNRVSTEPWIGTRAVRVGDIASHGSLSALRKKPPTRSVSSGWHLTSLGPPTVMQVKMQSYSHTEFDVPYYCDLHRLRVDWESEGECEWIPFDESFPAGLHAAHWQQFVWEKPLYSNDAAASLKHAHGLFGSIPVETGTVVVVGTGEVWLQAALERGWGDRFGGVYSSVEGLPSDGRGIWAVVDDLGACGEAGLAALHRANFGVVAFAYNARSFQILNAVFAGAAFPAGAARGFAEYRRWFADAERLPDRTDRIVTHGMFVPTTGMPDVLYRLGEQPFTVAGISKDALFEVIAHAAITTWLPPDNVKDAAARTEN